MKDCEIIDSDALVIENEFISGGICRIFFEAPHAAGLSTPGQFAMIEPSQGAFPVTRRPLTISDCNPAKGSISFVFQVVGDGTASLAGLRKGDRARILAPLGRGYSLEGGNWLLVAGGLGSAGFPFLLARVSEATVLIGARSAGRIVCCPPGASIATEDGSMGRRGLVTDLFRGIGWNLYDAIAVCGPALMMKAAVGAIPAEFTHLIQVSMESRMGCGWGVCGGCPVPAARGGYLSCCTDGPVFRACDIDWERVE